MKKIQIEIELDQLILYSEDGGRIKSLGYLRTPEETKKTIYHAIEYGKHLMQVHMRHTLGIFS